MSKFKVGDRVKANKKSNDRYLVTKAKYNWEGVVTEVRPNGFFLAKGSDDIVFTLQDEYFDLITDCTKKIIITSDGKTTTARLVDGKKTVKTAQAVCSDSYTFYFVTVAKIAFERLTAEEKKNEPSVKEVHRKAKVGEYIKILTDGLYGNSFTVGKVYEVEGIKGNLARIRKDDGAYTFGFAPHEYVVLEGYNPETKPDTEPEKKQDKPKYLNGRVVCIKTDYPWWTVGKVYDVKDGIITADDGDIFPKMGAEPYKSYEDIRHAGNGDGRGRKNPDNEFIEFKG